MMEKMEVANQKLFEASRTENQKLQPHERLNLNAPTVERVVISKETHQQDDVPLLHIRLLTKRIDRRKATENMWIGMIMLLKLEM